MSGNAQITDGQKLGIGGIFITRLGDIVQGMTKEAAQVYLGDADMFVADVRRRGIISVSAIDFSPWLSKWEKFYKSVYGRKYDFSGITIPQADDIFAWPVYMAGDIPAEDWLSAGKDPLPFWKYTSRKLDDVLNLSFGRDGWDRQYIVRFKANEEADDDFKNISAIKIAEMGINTATVKERLALGRFLYWDRKLILDRRMITYCTGSRYSDGHVPSVDWSGGKLHVSWYGPGDARPHLRPRQAVS